MLAKIHERCCTADEVVGTAMTCLFHFRGPFMVAAWLRVYAPDRQGILSTDQRQWLRGCHCFTLFLFAFQSRVLDGQ